MNLSVVSDMSEVVGTSAKLVIERLVVDVIIKDTRQAYGRTDYLVTPITGGGEQWVSRSRLLFSDK